MREIFDFIRRAGVFHLATVDAQGRPRLRPFGPCQLLDDQLHFVTHNVKPVYQQLLANPQAAIEAYDAETKEWLRLNGRVVWDEDPAVAETMQADAKARGMKPPVGDEVYFHFEEIEVQFCGAGRPATVLTF